MFFFKQKTAYESEYGLVGSEMCIRDSSWVERPGLCLVPRGASHDVVGHRHGFALAAQARICLLYTSDAADERSRVDLGGRRIINKKKLTELTAKTMRMEERTCTDQP